VYELFLRIGKNQHDAPNDDDDDDDDAGNATVRRASRVERRRHNARTNINGAAIETQRRVATVGT